MFKVNDYVIYNSMGVYKIIDIRKEKDINDEETEYYIMQPVYGNNLTIKTPVDNTKIFMREILDKDDAMSLLSLYLSKKLFGLRTTGEETRHLKQLSKKVIVRNGHNSLKLYTLKRRGKPVSVKS